MENNYKYQENYLDNLISDHNLIEKALILFEKEIAKNEMANKEILQSLISFIDEYGDTYHNQKEEQFYFPLLLQKGLPPMGPVNVMLMEHQNERELISEIKNLINKFENENIFDENLNNLIRDFCELTKNHIWKENDILYPMGAKLLDENDNKFLIDNFEKLSQEKYGQDPYKRFSIMLDSFEKKHGNKIDLLAELSTDVINNMIDALPVELSFVDENDIVRYFSHQNKKKIFHRSLGVVGRKVQKCHPEKSVHLVNQILEEMKAGTRDSAEFWINFQSMFVHISYYAVRDENGKYQGCVEMVHDISKYRKLEGEKRLLG
ncbi:MAG TPA: PAS domain-containing protein [Ignavibacteriales bacterium]|nr:PAS domain-containing protein [Ignavibacteriales bacterium]HOL80304.1 PAS domain-containing protein [Ignavibacteriales bacterium]HOM64583.1 PAS domain-containing protein [Ignavibacteriales bacterium]HPD66680.1 PAS domain-containing protein [Ignavibacteriales bacterium]HPP32493.1 PAS domain-containing protein [Ignavibacteriales bacterium]